MFTLVAVFGFIQTEYIVYEHEQSLNVCIALLNTSESLNGRIRQDVYFELETMDITAG